MKCEGLFTLVLFRPIRTSSQGVFLTLTCSWSDALSLCHNPYHWTVCVCLFVCLSDYLHVHFVRRLFFYLLEILY